VVCCNSELCFLLMKYMLRYILKKKHEGRTLGRTLLESDGPEHDWCIEVDHVDSGDLVKERNQECYDKLRPVLLLKDVPQWMSNL
jgi:hypothetical protein